MHFLIGAGIAKNHHEQILRHVGTLSENNESNMPGIFYKAHHT